MNPSLATLPQNILSDFIEAAHEIARRHLVECSSGNLSCRIDEHHILIKSSRSWLERLSPNDVSLCRLSDGHVLDGPKPSVEIGFHAGIMKIRETAKVVLHFQSPSATVLCCRTDLDSINFFVTPEVPYYIGPVGWVPFHLPGSPELANAVTEAAQNHALILLQNHGQVTFGENFDETIQRAVFFEMAARTVLQAGPNLQPLSPEHSQRLIEIRKAKTV